MVQMAIGNFDKSLSYFLEALKQTDQIPRRQVQAKLYRMESIARLYLHMHNAEKALETTNDALAMQPKTESPKIISSLQMTRGLALIDLGRHDEAFEAYKIVLQIANEAGMPALAATVGRTSADQSLPGRSEDSRFSHAVSLAERRKVYGSRVLIQPHPDREKANCREKLRNLCGGPPIPKVRASKDLRRDQRKNGRSSVILPVACSGHLSSCPHFRKPSCGRKT